MEKSVAHLPVRMMLLWMPETGPGSGNFARMVSMLDIRIKTCLPRVRQ